MVSPMRILLLGQNGQLGWEAKRTLACLGEVYSYDYPEVNFAKPQQLASLVKQHCPQVIFNAVAYTAVDRAEQEHETARLINAVAPGELAEAALKCSALLIHFSTDYVFDGAKNAPYLESDPTNPLNVYGQTKLDGEKAIAAVGGSWLTFRTSWVYSLRRESFVSKVIEWSRKQPVLRVVDDQISGPTSARMLAEICALLVARAGADPAETLRSRSRVYHLAGWGWCSRLDWAREILRIDAETHHHPMIETSPAKSADFPSPANRPLFSALDCDCFANTFGLQMPDWEQSLRLIMES